MISSKKNVLKAFGKLVKKRRLASKLSQEELGALSELDRTYISGIERGLRNLSLTAIVSISTSLKMTTAELLQGIEVEAKKNSGEEEIEL